MDSCVNECCNQSTKDFNIIACKNEEIAKLKRKIESHCDIMTERNELREQCKKNERWMEDSEKEHKKVFNELLNTFNLQSEKLKKVIEVECKWQDKYNELQECYHRTANDLKTAKSNENRLQCLFEECEKERKCTEKELSCTKIELEDKKCEYKQLKTRMKCVQDEISKLGKQLDECVRERNQLNEMTGSMAMDLKCATSKLAEMECNMLCVEEKFNLERESLRNALCEVEKRYEEANHKITEAKHKIKILTTSLKELKEASEKSHCEMKNQIKKLKEESCIKDEEICCSKQKINDLLRENEFNVMEINAQKIKLSEKECQLHECKLLLETNAICPTKPKCNSFCYSEMPTSITCGSNSIDSTSDICCTLSKHIKSLSQKSTSKGNGSNNSSVTTDLKKLQCEIESLKTDVGLIKKK